MVDVSVKERFKIALDALVAKLREDPYVLAVVVAGSMSHDVVWDKSDIDLIIVTQEVKIRYTALNLTEDDVNIHAYLFPRSNFMRCLQGSIRSSFVHSLIAKGTLLYTRDETIAQAFEARNEFGKRDQQVQALRWAAGALPAMYKAEKWLTVRRDCEYSALYLLFCVNSLAGIEAVLHGEITGREVIHQAMRLNPEVFNELYLKRMQGNNKPEDLARALEIIQAYLRTRTNEIFGPVLEYLAESRTVRSATDITDHFLKNMQIEGIDTVCEYLADEGIVRKLSSPVRVTEKSKISVEESAYYYDPDDII